MKNITEILTLDIFQSKNNQQPINVLKYILIFFMTNYFEFATHSTVNIQYLSISQFCTCIEQWKFNKFGCWISKKTNVESHT